MDWRDFVKRLLIDDGKISEREAQVIRRAVVANRVVDREEIELLADLKHSATTVHPEFDRFFFEVVERAVLLDGAISDAEARWLRRLFIVDNHITPTEAEFVKRLRRQAATVGPEFVALHTECTQLSAADYSPR